MAQVARTTWETSLATLIADNVAGDISAADMRSVLTDLEDSLRWYDETQLVLAEGAFVDGDKTKLNGIEAGATADQSNAEIEAAYNAQVAIASQAEAEAGTSTAVVRWTPQRVAQAIAALATGGTVTSGAGAPTSTPGSVGSIYIDTTNDVAYIATGTASSADWDELLTSASGTTLTAETSVGADAIPYFDASDSDNPKQTTITNFIADNSIQVEPAEGGFANGDKTKLDGIEAGADVTDAANVETAIEAIAFTSVSGATGDEVLVVDATDGGLKAVLWENLPGVGGGMTSFSVTGDSGTPEVVGDGNTLDIAGGTGIATSVGATDTVTVNVTGVLEDLNTTGAPTADGEMLVATGAGAFAYESGATLRASIGVAIGTDVQAFDADTLKADTADQLTAGFTAAVDDDGAAASPYTPDPDTGNFKRVTNDGAMTINPPTVATGEATQIILLVTNTTGAGAITTTGFTDVGGDSFTTTTTDEFLCAITAIDVGGTAYSTLHVTALQ